MVVARGACPCFFPRVCVGSKHLLFAEPICSVSTLVFLITLSVGKGDGREGGKMRGQRRERENTVEHRVRPVRPFHITLSGFTYPDFFPLFLPASFKLNP